MFYPNYLRIFRMPFIYAQLLMAVFLRPFASKSQDTVSLYSGKIPNARPGYFKNPPAKASAGMVYFVNNPILEIYLPEKSTATGAAVIICPGGSYKVLTYQAEGVRTAMELSKRGIAAFVLKYRLPDDSLMIDKKTGPLQDAQQAIKIVREHAAAWGLDGKKVGIMGFSAGGHLAATAATHFKTALIENENHTDLRPAFLILVYPVISMQQELTHADSRRNLLGPTPSKETVDYFQTSYRLTRKRLPLTLHTPVTISW